MINKRGSAREIIYRIHKILVFNYYCKLQIYESCVTHIKHRRVYHQILQEFLSLLKHGSPSNAELVISGECNSVTEILFAVSSFVIFMADVGTGRNLLL